MTSTQATATTNPETGSQAARLGSVAADSVPTAAKPVSPDPAPRANQPTHDDAHSAFFRTRHFGALDGLRAFSILAVVWHHSAEPLSYWPASAYGFLGVDLFFVISGFLIVTLLLRERETTGDISLRDFYIRRTLRIFPLYYAVLAALALLYGFVQTESEFGRQFIGELPIYLTYTGNLFPVAFVITWSLAAEEQFYLCWPFVERNLRRFVVPLLFFAIAANQLLNFEQTREMLCAWLDLPYLRRLPIAQCTFTPILLGLGLAHLLHSRTGFAAMSRAIQHRWAAPFWFGWLIFVCLLLPEDISGWPRLFVQISMTLLVGSCVVREDHRLMPLLRARPLVRLGMISYGIYLLHIHAIVVASKLLARLDIEPGRMLFVAGLALSVVAAELSYRYYETPFLSLKTRFSHLRSSPKSHRAHADGVAPKSGPHTAVRPGRKRPTSGKTR